MIGPRAMGAGTPGPGHRPPQVDIRPLRPQHKAHTLNNNSGGGGCGGGSGSNPPRTPAQRLIDQYERLSTPPPPQPHRSTYAQEYIGARTARPVNDAMRLSEMEARRVAKKRAAAELRRDRSPIRQSLRNLFSVIKKGAGGISKRRAEAAEQDEEGMSSVGYDGRAGSGDTLPAFPTARKEVPHGGQPHTGAPPTRRKMTGPLLYLTRGAQLLSPHTLGPLLWSACSVTVDGSKLIVAPFAGDADVGATALEIRLVNCADIRSLAPTQLSAEEAHALERVPDVGENMHVFELRFKDQRREKFAARSVRERAGWISAIWDSILPAQNEYTSAPQAVKREAATAVDRHTKPVPAKPIESPRPQHAPKLSPLLAPAPVPRSQRSLPPLPPTSPASLLPPAPATGKANAPSLHLDLSDLQGPISPSIYPPTPHAPSSRGSYTAPSVTSTLRNWHLNPVIAGVAATPGGTQGAPVRAGSYFVASPASMTPAASPTGSPSVANLSRLSVVRQRLAEIERTHSQISKQSTPAPTSPASSSGWSRREAVFHNAGARSRAGSVATSVGSPLASPEDRPVIVPQGYVDEERNERADEDNSRTLPAKKKAGPTKEDFRRLERDVGEVKDALGGAEGQRSVHEMVAALEKHARGQKTALRDIQDTLAVLGTRAPVNGEKEQAQAGEERLSVAAFEEGNARVVGLLGEVQAHLAADFPALAAKLEELKAQKGESAQAPTGADASTAIAKDCSGVSAADLQPVLDKLEAMRAAFEARKDDDKERSPSDTENIDKLVNLIKEDSNRQALLSQQQADSVRYLNELNTWLEAFVNNGTSQIQGISANLDRLCRELGVAEASATPNPLRPGARANLVDDIRQLVAGMKARDQNFTALQAAVHSLLDVLAASQVQNGTADPQALVGLLERQRHDQEALFRALTNEISGEIKGERLRFVEAMKEATAINVQMHVDQFKQEMGREVMVMAGEVGRLQMEKQHVESQISELYSFYSKHKQGDMPLQTIQENVPLSTPIRPGPGQGGGRVGIPRSHNRLPPYPRQ